MLALLCLHRKMILLSLLQLVMACDGLMYLQICGRLMYFLYSFSFLLFTNIDYTLCDLQICVAEED